jgi:hypothetical protein
MRHMDPRKWRVRFSEGWWWVIPPWSTTVAYRTPWFGQTHAMAERKRGLVERHVPHTPPSITMPAELVKRCTEDEGALLRELQRTTA